MKVCLVNPPLNMKVRLWYPVGICYVATYLRNAGYEVSIIDCIGDNLSREEFREQLNRNKAEAYGIGGLIMAFNNVVEISYMIRKKYPNAIIFAGNTVASTIPEILINNSAVQIAVMWEGELTAVNLMNALKKGEPLDTVKGIIFKNEEGKFIKTPDQPLIQNLDQIPLPAWDLIPMQNYLKNMNYYFPISTVRGCPNNCIFCCKCYLMSKVRARSPQNIIDEMVIAKKQFKIKFALMFDDNFCYNKKRVIEFCKLKMNTPEVKNIPWKCSSRVNLLTDDLVKEISKAKCWQIGVGYESASQKVLDYYNKGIKVEQMQKAVNLLQKYNLNINAGGASWLIGAENETRESVRKSRKFAKKNHMIYIPHFVTPYPGTVLYSRAKEQGLIKNELEYIKDIARRGNTNFLTVNLTKNFTDDDLKKYKKKMSVFPLKRKPITLKRIARRGPGLILSFFTLSLRDAIKNVKDFFFNEWNPKLEKYSNEWF